MAKIIIGLDEAGRGALAGPIVGAAVLTDGSKYQKNILKHAHDSKLLSPKKRQDLFVYLTTSLPWAVQILGNKFIDQRGIQTANVLVLEKSWQKLQKIAGEDYLLISDYVGGAKKYLTTEQEINFYKHGESRFKVIAAASIIAKVYRDKLMLGLHEKYLVYNFAQHKGYGTHQHLIAIKKHGLSPVHRQSFLKNI